MAKWSIVYRIIRSFRFILGWDSIGGLSARKCHDHTYISKRSFYLLNRE